jgi:adenosylhomocysteine nucleosidase
VKTVLFVASEAREFKGLSRQLPRLGRLRIAVDYVREAHHQGQRWLLLANGPGDGLAAQGLERVLAFAPVDAMVSTGYCGGLQPSLPPFALVAASEVAVGAGSERFAAIQPSTNCRVVSGIVLSTDHVVNTAEERTTLHRSTGALAVDMESAAIARAARRAGVPFFHLRIVTDTAAESFPIDFNRVRDSDGRFRRGRILLEAMRAPARRVPGLLAVRRRCEIASQILGECLAGCRFLP